MQYAPTYGGDTKNWCIFSMGRGLLHKPAVGWPHFGRMPYYVGDTKNWCIFSMGRGLLHKPAVGWPSFWAYAIRLM